MEEAQRLLTVSVWKLYRCRVRRGGLRLHRSLQLSLLVRAARHRYLSARAAAETLPGPALPGDAACGVTPDRGDLPRDPTGDPRNAWCPNRPTGDPGADQKQRDPSKNPTGDPRNAWCPNRPTGDPGADQKRGDPSKNPTGDPRNSWCPNRPSADLSNRPAPQTDPRTHQKLGNTLRDWAGDPPNLPTGAPCSERDPSRATEDPPSAPLGDSPAARAADPSNWDHDPQTASAAPPRPAGAPRAGQKRRSSGSAGPGRRPVPSKRARLDAEAPPLPPGPSGRCSGPPAAAFGFLVRAVGAC